MGDVEANPVTRLGELLSTFQPTRAEKMSGEEITGLSFAPSYQHQRAVAGRWHKIRNLTAGCRAKLNAGCNEIEELTDSRWRRIRYIRCDNV